MDNDVVDQLYNTLLCMLQYQIQDNINGETEVNNDYWFGRVADSIEIQRKIKQIIQEYKMKIEV